MDVVEAARLDGCGALGVIFRIAAPMSKSGLVCTMLLSFLDAWNMVEQPMVYLRDYDMYPISVGLATTPPFTAGAASFLASTAAGSW